MAKVIHNTPRGKVRDYAPMIQYVVDNRIYQRQVPAEVRDAKTPEQENDREDFREMSEVWSDMSDADRATWSTYAGTTRRAKPFRATNMEYTVAPFGAFMQSRLMQARLVRLGGLGFTGNPTLAPLGYGIPDPPTNVAAAYAAGVITVTWNDPVAFYADSTGLAVEVWAKLAANSRLSWAQLVGAVGIGVRTFSFSRIKSHTRATVTVQSILLASLAKAAVRVQLRFVEQPTARVGAVPSTFSAQAKVRFTNL